MEQQELWPTNPDISTKELDSYVEQLRALKTVYDEATKEKERLSAEYTKQKNVVMEALRQANKESYIVDGIGKVKLQEEQSVKTPKSPEEKDAFFAWVKNKLGADAYYTYMSVNSQSLNSLYKRMKEESRSRGEAEFSIDGLEEPTAYYKLSFTKA